MITFDVALMYSGPAVALSYSTEQTKDLEMWQQRISCKYVWSNILSLVCHNTKVFIPKHFVSLPLSLNVTITFTIISNMFHTLTRLTQVESGAPEPAA